MITAQKGWHKKTHAKAASFNYEKSQNRFHLLKTHNNYIYPNLVLYENNVSWEVYQKHVQTCRGGIFFTKNQINILAEKIDQISSLGIVHGDLCFSNIGFGRDNLILLYDWEINLEIRKKDNLILRTSPYCLHPKDYEERNITELSDRFSMAALTLISCHNVSWRSCLSFNQCNRLRIADFIDSLKSFSNVELVDRLIYKIEGRKSRN